MLIGQRVKIRNNIPIRRSLVLVVLLLYIFFCYLWIVLKGSLLYACLIVRISYGLITLLILSSTRDSLIIAFLRRTGRDAFFFKPYKGFELINIIGSISIFFKML